MEVMNKISAKWDAVFLGPIILGQESIPSKTRPSRPSASFPLATEDLRTISSFFSASAR